MSISRFRLPRLPAFSSAFIPFQILSSSPSLGDQEAREPYSTTTSAPSPLTRLLTTPRRLSNHLGRAFTATLGRTDPRLVRPDPSPRAGPRPSPLPPSHHPAASTAAPCPQHRTAPSPPGQLLRLSAALSAALARPGASPFTSGHGGTRGRATYSRHVPRPPRRGRGGGEAPAAPVQASSGWKRERAGGRRSTGSPSPPPPPSRRGAGRTWRGNRGCPVGPSPHRPPAAPLRRDASGFTAPLHAEGGRGAAPHPP